MAVNGVLFCRHHIRMDVGCAECLGPDDWHPAWDDDLVQFARLLCEIVANIDLVDIGEVSRSMDLSESELDELFDRADAVWEIAKGERIT